MGNESQKRCHKNLQKNKSHRTLKIEKMKQILDVNIYILSLYNIVTYTVYILNNVIINFIASLCLPWRKNQAQHRTDFWPILFSFFGQQKVCEFNLKTTDGFIRDTKTSLSDSSFSSTVPILKRCSQLLR